LRLPPVAEVLADNKLVSLFSLGKGGRPGSAPLDEHR